MRGKAAMKKRKTQTFGFLDGILHSVGETQALLVKVPKQWQDGEEATGMSQYCFAPGLGVAEEDKMGVGTVAHQNTSHIKTRQRPCINKGCTAKHNSFETDERKGCVSCRLCGSVQPYGVLKDEERRQFASEDDADKGKRAQRAESGPASAAAGGYITRDAAEDEMRIRKMIGNWSTSTDNDDGLFDE